MLGLGYILFFNDAANPLNFLYGTHGDPGICTLVHFYTSSHLTAVTALKQLDDEFESVSASLKVPFYKTFWRVTVPVCLPSHPRHRPLLLRQRDDDHIGGRVPVLARRQLAAVAILNLDEAGDIGAAAAMATLIVAASTVVTCSFIALGALAHRRTQDWRSSGRSASAIRILVQETIRFEPRPDSAHARPAHDLRAHQAGDAARLGLVGRDVQRRHRRAARAALAVVDGGYACRASRCRAAAPSRSRPR